MQSMLRPASPADGFAGPWAQVIGMEGRLGLQDMVFLRLEARLPIFLMRW